MPDDEIKDDVLPQMNAREFNLVDSNGKVRMKISVDDGDFRMVIKDTKGKARLDIGVGADGSTQITVIDEQGVRNNIAQL